MTANQGPRTEFSQALKAIAQERGLDAEVIMETIRQAYVAAYKRDAKERGEDVESFDYEAEINPLNGEAKILGWPIDEEGNVTGDKSDVTPPGFGRIAAQTAKQVIHQKIREAEKGAVMDEFGGRVGSLISGIVLRFDGPNVRVDLGRTEAIMPAEERIPTERLNPSQRITFLLKAIEDTPHGKQIILSRADLDYVKAVFAREVPEIASGSVEIRGIAREPGVRTKIAVFSSQSGVDPVGSCVGQKGVRVQSVTNELGGERVDIIPWTENEEEFVRATLSPVEAVSVQLDRDAKTAIVVVPADQLSIAIGKEGQNVRLASRLTGWRIEVQGPDGEVTVEDAVEKTASTEEQVPPEEVQENAEQDKTQ
ncbi:transcription termination/antitermination protein NusA [Candidatus Microgenomates bacterium]|nr:MAG: transcription termination/antitermination protein NusA [Candidatus Microgenomates bacterium]